MRLISGATVQWSALSMKLRSKLIISFAGVASLIILVGVFGILAGRQASETFSGIINNSSPQLATLGLLQAAANDLRETAIHQALLKQIDSAEGSVEEVEFNIAKEDLADLLNAYKQVAEEPELVEEISRGNDALAE